MEWRLKKADDDFRWLNYIWRKCKIGKSDDAKLSFWLKHGFILPQDDFLDFKVELEADWILKPLNIKIIHQKSRCQTCNKECDQEKYFQDSIRAFAKRCLKPMKQFTSFQELFDAWSAEDVPCPKCDNGYCHVTRRLDCAQGPPPLLPVPTFFEVSESSGSNTQLGEFLLPVQLNDQTLEQPQGFTTGINQYQLHSMSYAILKQDNRTGETYPHERCKVWDGGLDLWMYYDGESWNEQYKNYKLRTARDKTPGKSYRVAYFRLV